MSQFLHSYASLGDNYVAAQRPSPVSSPMWLAFNDTLAEAIDWPQAWRRTDEGLGALSGNHLLPNSEPVATVYAGHQFGSYNPQLGDGRAILLGEWSTEDSATVDIQLKGAGPTPFSRGGDGRSPIGPVIREYLVSEAMHALGVPTTRALAAVATGDTVYREVPEPGAVLTRVASSHLRIGTVQFFAMSRKGEGVEALVDHVVERHYAREADRLRQRNPAMTNAAILLESYGSRLAGLVARWQVIGFVHGVLNTDNMLLCGETVDYGPCALMDHFDPKAKFSSIDTQGRYAWPNQPPIAHWNYSVLAQCLLPLLDENESDALTLAQAAVDAFPRHYGEAYHAQLAARFGLGHIGESEQALIDEYYEILAAEQLDLTLACRWLAEQAADTAGNTPLGSLFIPPRKLLTWYDRWQVHRQQTNNHTEALTTTMLTRNPCVIPRNHQVAAAIDAAESGDLALFTTLQQRWQSPWQWQEGDEQLAEPPRPEERVYRTFCGT